jgi:hypothetical protein
MSLYVVNSLPYTFSGPMANTLRNTSGELLYSGTIAIGSIYWSGIVSVGDVFTLVDQNNVTLATHTADSGDLVDGVYAVNYPSSLRCTDFKITTMTSGNVTLGVSWAITGSPTPMGGIIPAGKTFGFTSPNAGNFTLPHNLGYTPTVGVIEMQAPPFGEVQFQTPTKFDSANIYLYASAPGLSGVIWVS